MCLRMAVTHHTSEIHSIASLTLQHITVDHISHVDESLRTVVSTVHLSQSASDVSTTTKSAGILKGIARIKVSLVLSPHRSTSQTQESTN